ncbi:hypothetical protein PoB_006673100 [Plakobranchus ocellatus]|uniref:C-type lectin domain-containing protein n=1 Tax=Plakobranchus ocellatus TaxID=259542 RepID=A0AAV4D7U1_9GAST|nr:hypothetical protein PoB_006673100 [Plakobranchus ocellatus]
MGDFNAKVGTEKVDDIVGKHGLGIRSEQGDPKVLDPPPGQNAVEGLKPLLRFTVNYAANAPPPRPLPPPPLQHGNVDTRSEENIMNAVFWVICVLAIVEKVHSRTDRDLCGEDWHYHKHTSTCIRLFRTRKYLSAAKCSCESYKGGPSGKEAGWLVGIHDNETDSFVRSLLNTNEKAFFGLVYSDNEYTWVDKISFVNDYSNWWSGHPLNYLGSPYKYAVVTKYGWESQY